MKNQELTKEYIKELLLTSDKAVKRGVLRIYEFQTQDEQEAQTTKLNNGVGFNGADAYFIACIALWVSLEKQDVKDFLYEEILRLLSNEKD